MPLPASTPTVELEAAVTPQNDKALSITEGVQSTASAGSHASADDSASSISGMSGVSSIAATEVVDDQQDAATAPGRLLGPSSTQEDWLCQCVCFISTRMHINRGSSVMHANYV